ncbi:MAG: EAL domain-containing protein [Steroidobacteraceae bacterium]|jgi:diguanylate cyclase (GGDEF)-like protein/PAS domain S-box-containing protein
MSHSHAKSEPLARVVLLIQDDERSAGLIGGILDEVQAGAFKVDCVKSCKGALERLAHDEWSGSATQQYIVAIIWDLSTCVSDAMVSLAALLFAARQIPILVLCAAQQEEIAKAAVNKGAQDYLLMDHIDGYSLPKAIQSMIERASNVEASFEQNERAQVTLNSIGDAVISTGLDGHVTYLNPVAESLTGWSLMEAVGRRIEDVFRIVDGVTRNGVANPMIEAIGSNRTVALSADCVLIRRDGQEFAIEDSVAPIHDRRGRVTGAVMVFDDVTESRAQSVRMSYQAQHDSLTNLPNRALINEQLTQAAALANRSQHQLAVLFIDLDRFKYVNDSLGHEMGDRLLQSVAGRVLSCVRTSDVAGRIGGDEFIVLLTQIAQPQDAAVCAEKILQCLSAPHLIDGHQLKVTASIGIATCPEDGVDANSLMKNADLAMYHAKDSGRNNYKYFQSEMNRRAVAHVTLEHDLRHALEHGEFALFFQPTISLTTRGVTGIEALLRWWHPTRGLLLPESFMSVAEESGCIVPIGRWVLATACRQARLWQDACIPPIPMAVNCSAVELRDPNFVAGVADALAQSGLEPSKLVLELTETVMLQDLESTVRVLQSLKDIGVHLALDDFGTGFSSLSHLQRFPIDVLKIDQSFIRNLSADSSDASIVGAVIGMADSLRMRVVAEGVETEQQLNILAEQCCPEAQGYYFSRPLIAEDLTALLWQSQWQKSA